MQWYSIKKYLPPSCTYVFIRAIKKDKKDCRYDRYFIAMIEDLDKVESLEEWEHANGNKPIMYPSADAYLVTHFCILDPIEREETC